MRTLSLGIFLILTACSTAIEQSAPPQAAAAPSTTSGRIDVAPLRFTWTPAELTAACTAAEQTTNERLATLVAIPDSARTFANSFAALERIVTDYGDSVGRLTFMKDIHTDEQVRAAAGECEARAGKYGVELSARKDLFLAMRAFLDGSGKTAKLDDQDRRLVDLTMRDFTRNGLALSDADRAKLVALRSRLAELQTKYSSRLAEDKTTLEATAAELADLPKSFIDRLAKSPNGKYVLTTKYPDYFPIIENAKNAALRKRMQIAFNHRGGADNVALLDEAVTLRDQAARLLGYSSHADFVTEVRMAKNAKTVAAFEARLKLALRPRLDADVKNLLALKQVETKEKSPTIYSWDWRYYLTQLKKRDFSIDDEAVRAYFPADKVVTGMFKVYADLFSIDIREEANAPVWADGVKYFAVTERGSGELLARFYVDFFPRPGKYGHAACFPFSAARAKEAGYQIPSSALVLNFNPPEKGQPAKLSLNEVDTLFHEFGHVMHASLTSARYASLAGTNVATDFVEAPSQMLENWVYRPEVLALISQDPKDPSKGLPEDLSRRLIAARKFDAGVKYSRQVFLGTFDLGIHTGGAKVDTAAVARQAWLDIVGFPQDPSEQFAAGFGHMMTGYDAGYYGYLWSEVFAADMFTRFEKEGVLNEKTGHAYREHILSKGRTADPDALLRDFLGREPNEEAFLKLSGIKL